MVMFNDERKRERERAIGVCHDNREITNKQQEDLIGVFFVFFWRAREKDRREKKNSARVNRVRDFRFFLLPLIHFILAQSHMATATAVS